MTNIEALELAIDELQTLRTEITTLRQQLAEQPNVDVLVEALETISNWRFSWDGDCGVTSVADKALATYQSKNEKE